MKLNLKDAYYNYLWWGWQIILILISIFFLYFGIEVLIHAYKMDNPFYFIITFFSSNLIIMISAVILAGLVYRLYGVIRLIRGKKGQRDIGDEPEHTDESDPE